jgi:hypothetical protein
MGGTGGRRAVRGEGAATRGVLNVSASPGTGGTVPGVLSRALLDAVAGGEALVLRHRGEVRAVLVDPDTWAELQDLSATAPA